MVLWRRLLARRPFMTEPEGDYDFRFCPQQACFPPTIRQPPDASAIRENDFEELVTRDGLPFHFPISRRGHLKAISVAIPSAYRSPTRVDDAVQAEQALLPPQASSPPILRPKSTL